MQKFEYQINNILNISEQYNSILSLNSVLTVLPEYYLATAILSMAIFFSISPKILSKSFKQTKFSLFSSISFQFNYLAILIIFFYCFLSIKQNFLFLSDFVSFNNSLHNDFISLLSKLLIGISSLVYLIFVQQFLTDQKINYLEYYILILTSILGFCLLCCSDDLLTAYLAIELQSLAFYVLSAFKRNSNYSVESGIKYFILGSFSTIIFLFGSNLIYGLSGSISIIDFKDLFIWIFSANSFFLSFESISKVLESFQNKTFKLENNNIKDLQTIYDKFLILKNNASLTSSDLNTFLLEFENNKSLVFSEETDSLYKNISKKMIQIANQIDSSSFYYYKTHIENNKEIGSSIQFAKDLVLDSLLQNSTIWFMTDMQNLGNKYENLLDFKQNLNLIYSYSDFLEKFNYNWFFINNLTNYSSDFEYIIKTSTKNQDVLDINEFFYFNHLSNSLDVLQISDSNSNNCTTIKKINFISEKLKLLGYISLSDANFILLEIQKLLNNKLLETNLFSENEVNLYKTFSEILINKLDKNNFNLEQLPENFNKITNYCFKILLFIDTFYSSTEKSMNSQCFENTLLSNNVQDLTNCVSKSMIIDNNKILLDYFYNISSFLLYFIKTQDIYADSDFKNFAINEDLKLNYEKEKLSHLKVIAKKFELFGSKTTLSLQEVKSILLNSKDLLTSNFFSAEKAKLYQKIANNMKFNYNSEIPIFNDRINRLKNSNEFEFLISSYKTSFLELTKIIRGCINSKNQNSDIVSATLLSSLVESLDISLLENNFSFKFDNKENLYHNLTLIDKFYNFNFENLLLVYSDQLLNNNEKIDVFNCPLINSEQYYLIYEKCLNTFEMNFENNFSCLQIVNNKLVDLTVSKKTWLIAPELLYYKDLAIIFNYLLYYTEPSEFFDSFNILSDKNLYENNLQLILYKLEIFGKETHLSFKEIEVFFSLLHEKKFESKEIFQICKKISDQLEIIVSNENNNFNNCNNCNNCDNLFLIKFNSLKNLENFKTFEHLFFNVLMVLNNTIWTYYHDFDQLYNNSKNFLEKYSNSLDIISFKVSEFNFPLVNYIESLNKKVVQNDEVLCHAVLERNYFSFLKILTIIFNYLPYFLSSNEIFDNFSLLPKYLNDTQRYDFLNFILFKLKNFKENYFLTKWELELLLNEIRNINYNLNDLKKNFFYIELSQILDLTFNKFSNDSFSQLKNFKTIFNNRPIESEASYFYFSIKEILLKLELKHELMSKTLASIFQDENLYSQYIKPNNSFLIEDTKYSSYNVITQNNESSFVSLAHIFSLFSLFFNFSYNFNETSNFIFDTSLIELGVLIILISLFFKLALSPFHLWSPDVYEGSPSSSTFFFTVISKLSIFIFLLKICYVSFYSIIQNWQLYSLIVAILSIIIGSIGGLKQRKFKSILAYSSISNMGLILVSFSAGNFEGIKAFFYYFILYIISGLAVWSIFLILKLKKKIPSEKHNKDLGDFSMLHELNVILAYASVITIFSISGIPPMVGFLAKVSIFLSLTEASMYCIALISILASVVSTFFYIRILKVIFFENILVGKLFYSTNSKDNIIRSFLFFLLLFFFISPSLPSFFAYKSTLFLNKNFY